LNSTVAPFVAAGSGVMFTVDIDSDLKALSGHHHHPDDNVDVILIMPASSNSILALPAMASSVVMRPVPTISSTAGQLVKAAIDFYRRAIPFTSIKKRP
jgi:hypothetical protein